MRRFQPRPFKHPLLALLSVLAMGIGIGSVTGTFSVASAILADPPVPEPDRLVHVGRAPERFPGRFFGVTPGQLQALRDQSGMLATVGGYRSVWAHVSGPEGPPRSIRSVAVTGAVLRTLGVRPLMGRWIEADDEAPGAQPVVVMAHHLWQSRYGGDPSLVGGQITLNGRPTTVVGIMPEGFRFPNEHYLWFPPRSEGVLRGVGRLARGSTLEAFRSELEALSPSLLRASGSRPASLVARPFAEEILPDIERRTARGVLGMGVIVLLAACLNVATLLLLRGLQAGRETAVRMALGAPRAVLVGERIAETATLAALGGVLAIGVTFAVLRMVYAAFGEGLAPWGVDLGFRPSVAVVGFGTVVVAAGLAGLLPALRGTDIDISRTLRDSVAGSSVRLGRALRWLVAIEVAASCMLVVADATILRGARASLLADPDVPADRILMSRYELLPERHPDPETRVELHRRVQETLAARPGVEAVALTDVVPIGLPSSGWDAWEVEIEGSEFQGEGHRPPVRVAAVSPGYFGVLGTGVVRGRDFTWDDGGENARNALVTETFARHYMAGDDVLGRRFKLGESYEWTVVGVVPDVGLGGRAAGHEGVYLPLPERPWAFVYVILRATGDPLALAPAVRETIWDEDDQVPIYRVASLEGLEAEMTRPARVMAPSLSVFGLAALLLTALGLHGLMGFSVGRRRREIAVRFAVGAPRHSVSWLVLRSSLAQVLAGMAVGLALAFWFTPILGELLFGTDPHTWGPYALAGVIMVGTALTASAAPLRRALQVEITEELRVE